MFVTADQLVCHAIGDYVLQSDWMAEQKTRSSIVALAHAASYALPFLFLSHAWLPLLVIVATHFVIDRFKLARFIVYAKNLAAPKRYRYLWAVCRETGYRADRPQWLTVWLYIIADNVLHVLCNAATLRWL